MVRVHLDPPFSDTNNESSARCVVLMLDWIINTEQGDLAQLGERLPCTQEVRSSILLVSTNIRYYLVVSYEEPKRC